MKLKAFAHWFKNSFWYHYKWHAIATLACVLFVVSFVISLASRERPDFAYILAYESAAGEIAADEWDEPAREALADINGDGQLILYSHVLCFNEETELGYAARIKFTAELTNDDTLLMVLDEATLGELDLQGAELLPLAELGLPAEPDRPWLHRVEPPAPLRALGADGDFFLCVKALTPEKRDRPETRALYEQAALFARMILEIS